MLNQGVEKISYRVAMVQAGIIHPVLGSLPSQGSLPVPMIGTGTVATVNNDPNNGQLVIGTNTKFLNDTQVGSKTKFTGQVEPGDYIAVNVNGQFLRRITQVLSDTRLMIEAPFPSSLNGNFYIVKKHPYRLVVAKCVGTGAILQEQSISLNEIFINGGSPITYDCSAAGAALDIQMNY